MAPSQGSQKNSQEMPSMKPDSSSASNQQSKPTPQTASPEEAEERHLHKVDIVRESGDGEMDVGNEQQESAEKGLHMADQNSGADALGESGPQEQAPNKAIGVAEQEGEDKDDDTAAMEEDVEAQTGKDAKPMESMPLQQMDDTAPDALRPRPEADAAEPDNQSESLTMQTAVGSTTNLATVTLHAVAALEGADESAADTKAPESEEIVRRRRPEAEVRQLWTWLEGCTAPLAAALCEQLRTILEPTLKG